MYKWQLRRRKVPESGIRLKIETPKEKGVKRRCPLGYPTRLGVRGARVPPAGFRAEPLAEIKIWCILIISQSGCCLSFVRRPVHTDSKEQIYFKNAICSPTIHTRLGQNLISFIVSDISWPPRLRRPLDWIRSQQFQLNSTS